MDMPQGQANDMVDVDSIIDKIEIPQDLKPIYDKAVLSGLRIMFDKSSHQMLLDQLEKEGPMAPKMAEGLITLVYMLWEQSNKTLPPQILIPLTFTLTLKAFDFLQQSGDQEATKQVLGEAMELTVTGIMERCGVPKEQIAKAVSQSGPIPGMQGGLINSGEKNGV